MAQKIKVHIAYRGEYKDVELSLKSAKNLVKQALDSGAIVVDKRNLEVLHEINQDIEEILIMDIIAGG